MMVVVAEGVAKLERVFPASIHFVNNTDVFEKLYSTVHSSPVSLRAGDYEFVHAQFVVLQERSEDQSSWCGETVT